MEYKYDPILCMNIPVGKSKVKDASWKAWTLYIDGKWVKSFTSEMAPIKEAQKFMKENYPGKVGKLVRNTGSSSGYSISGSESRDSISSVDKAINVCDEERKIGEFGGIKYEITENSDGSFNIKLNGQPHKNHVRFSSLREAEKNVQMNIGEILSYERATGKKALIRNFA